jgi:hypothetical protein
MNTSLEEFILKEYDAGKSTYEIVEILAQSGVTNFYPNKINRMLRKAGKPIRSKSQSQKLVLANGRAKHPTEGKIRDAATRARIGDGISKAYHNDPNAFVVRSKNSKERWDKLSTDEKLELRSKAYKAIRRSADFGSKVERFLLKELKKLGFNVVFHSNTLIPNQNIQIDIFLPEIQTVIEVDGKSHFEPVWGDERFEKTKQADQEKNGLVTMWYNMIRLEASANKITGAYCRKVLDRLISVIDEKIKGVGLLPIEERLIFLREES